MAVFFFYRIVQPVLLFGLLAAAFGRIPRLYQNKIFEK